MHKGPLATKHLQCLVESMDIGNGKNGVMIHFEHPEEYCLTLT